MAGHAALAVAHRSIPITLRTTSNPSDKVKNTTKSRTRTPGSQLS